MSTVPAGSLANASLVGANTVHGPGPDSVSTKPAALTAATSGGGSFELTAFWTMFLVEYIAAPPTIGFFTAAMPAVDPIASAVASINFCTVFMSFSSASWLGGGDTAAVAARLQLRLRPA